MCRFAWKNLNVEIIQNDLQIEPHTIYLHILLFDIHSSMTLEDLEGH